MDAKIQNCFTKMPLKKVSQKSAKECKHCTTTCVRKKGTKTFMRHLSLQKETQEGVMD